MKKTLRQGLSCLLLCTMLTALLCTPASADFQDVPSGHWAGESIERCAELGFFKGETQQHFGLGHQMTRSAFVVVLCRFFGWEAVVPETPTYQDVPVDAWYAGAVEAAFRKGAIANQRSDFRPTDPITREELAVMLVRALGYGSIAGLMQDLPLPFTDITSNRGYLTIAYDLGLVNGTTATTFSPKKTATREQVAVILMRLYDKLHTPPETVGIVTAEKSLAGLDVAAIAAANMEGVTLNSVMDKAATDALLTDARANGTKTLLHVSIDTLSLNSASRVSAILADAVEVGGYDGLYLETPAALPRSVRASVTKLASALDDRLGGKLLYVTADAPDQGGTAGAYDYAALCAAADRLVVRIPTVESTAAGMLTAPIDPLEDVYFALNTLRDEADIGKISLLLTTTPIAREGSSIRGLSAQELAILMADSSMRPYYSDRFAAPYLMGTTAKQHSLVVWYADARSAAARRTLVQGFGSGSIVLSDWNYATQALLTGLQ